jgi:hypothetical protein
MKRSVVVLGLALAAIVVSAPANALTGPVQGLNLQNRLSDIVQVRGGGFARRPRGGVVARGPHRGVVAGRAAVLAPHLPRATAGIIRI